MYKTKQLFDFLIAKFFLTIFTVEGVNMITLNKKT